MNMSIDAAIEHARVEVNSLREELADQAGWLSRRMAKLSDDVRNQNRGVLSGTTGEVQTAGLAVDMLVARYVAAHNHLKILEGIRDSNA